MDALAFYDEPRDKKSCFKENTFLQVDIEFQGKHSSARTCYLVYLHRAG